MKYNSNPSITRLTLPPPGAGQAPNAAPGRLYGRDSQLDELRIAYDRVRRDDGAAAADSATQVVLVHGASGTGKTCLVQAAFGMGDDGHYYV